MPTSRLKKRTRSQPRHESEVRAARWYRRRGWRVLATNVWLGGAELDLVVRRGRLLVFCEVKSKAGDGFGDPLEMVTPEKIRRIRRAAELWLARHPNAVGMRVRFDVIADRAGRLEHLANAFE
ncbi:MAG TPA: YraN family protein [Gaiellaceae bacterium]